MDFENKKLIRVSGGATGVTTGIYTSRANLKPLILAGEINIIPVNYNFCIPGGQLTLTFILGNYPGFSEGN